MPTPVWGALSARLAQAFTQDAQGLAPDDFHDDQALVLRAAQGNIVITGCCHCGWRMYWRNRPTSSSSELEPWKGEIIYR
jgi:metal-dependent hydrolase (beta-lactamase superfamily II)